MIPLPRIKLLPRWCARRLRHHRRDDLAADFLHLYVDRKHPVELVFAGSGSVTVASMQMVLASSFPAYDNVGVALGEVVVATPSTLTLGVYDVTAGTPFLVTSCMATGVASLTAECGPYPEQSSHSYEVVPTGHINPVGRTYRHRGWLTQPLRRARGGLTDVQISALRHFAPSPRASGPTGGAKLLSAPSPTR